MCFCNWPTKVFLQLNSLFHIISDKDIVAISGAIASKEREVPEYIQADDKNKKAKLVRVPKFAEIPYPTIMSPNLVIEYYSR